jgi:hypothetical protein
MAQKIWTNEEVDKWWDQYLAADPESQATVTSSTQFTVFKLRFGMYSKRRKYIPEKVREIMVRALNEFCSLPTKGVYVGQYIDAFAFSCSIKDYPSAKKAYDLITDKSILEHCEIPGYFYTWFESQKRKQDKEST